MEYEVQEEILTGLYFRNILDLLTVLHGNDILEFIKPTHTHTHTHTRTHPHTHTHTHTSCPSESGQHVSPPPHRHSETGNGPAL